MHVQPIDAYRGYEDFHPDADKAVLVRAAKVELQGAPVRIFQEAFPEGITLTQGAFGVSPGYHHHLIGKFAYSPGKVVSKAELVARVKKLAVAAGGDGRRSARGPRAAPDHEREVALTGTEPVRRSNGVRMACTETFRMRNISSHEHARAGR